MQHVDAVVNELKQQEMAKLPLSAELQARIAGSDAPSFGPVNARVTVVAFSDFQCPFCSKAADVTRQLKAKYGEKIRFVFRNFPLPFHKNAESAAEASLAANAQGKFWEMHDKMFANQKRLDRDSLESYAKDLGLDMSKFRAALDSRDYENSVRADASLASEAVVRGTPTLFVNGRRVNVSNGADVIKSVESALAGE
jgi:protein-disulfide isomerase